MKARALAIALSLVAVGLVMTAPAAVAGGGAGTMTMDAVSTASTSDDAQATRLVNRFFSMLHDKDVAGLRAFLSPGFQVERADGSGSDKAGYLAAPPKVDAYSLSNLQATRVGDTIVVRYTVTASEKVNGVTLTKDPAPRLTVFQRNPRTGSWQLLAHANFNPVVPTTT